jgi:glycosyltransferase involved in cell wall biosynthesis
MSVHAVSIIIPVYNERAALTPFVSSLRTTVENRGVAYEYLIVDDGSTDGSGEGIEEGNGVRLLRHERNRGYGAALKTGIHAASHDWILIIDADGTYPVDRIADLVHAAQTCDMAVGARTGKNVTHSALRRVAKWPIHRLADYLVDARIPDLNSGLRLFRKELAQRYHRLLPDGFSFTSSITLAMLADGWRVQYLPIDYHKRAGSSKVRPVRDAVNYLTLVMRMILFFNPLKIFMPLALVLLAATVGSLGYDVWQRDLTEKTLILMVGFIQVALLGMLADLINRRGAH